VIGSSGERDQLVLELDAFCNRLGLVEEKVRRVQVVAEELILNAVYEAPRDADGNPKYQGVDRQAPLTLAAQEQVRVRFGSDGRQLALSVADRFGSLDRNRVAEAMARGVEGQPRAQRAATRGLGLAAAFAAANQLVFHRAARRFTEVTAAIYIAGSNRAALTRGSSLLWCEVA
jgi:hypothetical protein